MIKTGIIGSGLIGKKRAEAIRAAGGGSSILAFCDIDAGKARELAGSFGGSAFENWEDVLRLPGLEAVIVATPNKYLTRISLAALERGLHVLCEKPLGRNAREAEMLFFKAREKAKILKTGFNHRHHPAVFKAKELLDRGEIGGAYYVRCVYGHGGRPGYEKEWRASKDICGGGELLDQGVHVLDLFRWFLGEFEEVYGRVERYGWDMEVEDNAFALLRTAAGQTALMHTSWTQWKNQFLFEVFGREGYLVVEGLGGSYGAEKLAVGRRKREQSPNGRDHPAEIRFIGGAPDEEILEFPGPDVSWVEEWKEFVRAVEQNRAPLGSGYDGLMANFLVDAVYRSAATGLPVKMSPRPCENEAEKR